jgi:hypothetical protein
MLVFLLAFSSMGYADIDSVASSGMPTFSEATTGGEVYGDDTKATKGTTFIAKLSSGVSVAWTTSAQAYILATQHQAGSKSYASSSDSSSIYSADATIGKPFVGSAFTNSDSSEFNGEAWEEM